jgi:hypothetical protein
LTPLRPGNNLAMVVPTQHTACPCNTAAPIKAKKERFDPLPGFKGKGRLTLNAVPCVIEVITNPNYTQTQMAQKLGMTQGYISTLRKKHAAQEDLVQFPKPPKGKVLRCRFIRTARNIIGKDPNASAADVASGIWRRWKVPMSRQTAWRLITKDLGKAFKLKKKKPAKGVPVTRLKFATELRKLIERENPIFLWTDETYAGTRDSVRGQYVDEGKEHGVVLLGSAAPLRLLLDTSPDSLIAGHQRCGGGGCFRRGCWMEVTSRSGSALKRRNQPLMRSTCCRVGHLMSRSAATIAASSSASMSALRFSTKSMPSIPAKPTRCVVAAVSSARKEADPMMAVRSASDAFRSPFATIRSLSSRISSASAAIASEFRLRIPEPLFPT